jgi:phage repressor protein C with HTH and peptisase S24 domain
MIDLDDLRTLIMGQGRFALVVDGDCMEPKYRNSEVLSFDRAAAVRSGDDCLVVFFDSAGDVRQRFKRIFLEPGGLIRLQPLNPKYQSCTLQRSQVLALVRAVARARAVGDGFARPGRLLRRAGRLRLGLRRRRRAAAGTVRT